MDDQPLGVGDADLRIVAVIVGDQLNLPAVDASFGVDFIDEGKGAVQSLLAQVAGVASQSHGRPESAAFGR